MKENQPFDLRARVRSFGYALEGWRYLVRNEHNSRIHLFVATIVFMLGIWLQIGRIEWAILMLTFTAVLAGEMFNSAIEAIVDMTSPDPHPLAKAAKDVAAGGVLFAACAAVIIGLLILGPPLWEKLTFLMS
ncbi:MAG: diacylglycerol kinase family protein [Candidatus Promineifilaceae bacterium]